MMECLQVNKERLQHSFIELEQFGKTAGGGITRPALSLEDKLAREKLCEWMREAGLTVRVDDAGNYYGHRKGKNESLSPVVMGSHIDTVYHGGRFDGITGVQAALEVIRTWNDCNIETLRPVEMMVFTNEEGTRFEPSMLGSGVLAGVFDIEKVKKIKDMDGFSYGEELEKIGFNGTKENRLKEAHAYLEMHVEQGPVLDMRRTEIGVVKGIRGMLHLEITIEGVKDHAGPSPMEYRKDAMMGACQIIAKMEEICKIIGHDTTITVGKIKCDPCSSNVIPKMVSFSVDVRNEEDMYMDQARDAIKKLLHDTCEIKGLTYVFDEFWRVNAIHFPNRLVELVEESTKKREYSYIPIVSGAGHDASYMSSFIDTAMIFVPSIGGLSHCEEELSDYTQIAKGANVLSDTALILANEM